MHAFGDVHGIQQGLTATSALCMGKVCGRYDCFLMVVFVAPSAVDYTALAFQHKFPHV